MTLVKVMKKKERISIPSYTLGEELVNSISHGIAALFAIAGLVLLVIKASSMGALRITTVTIFGTTMIVLYTISCIYHALSSKIVGKKVLRVLDHCNVYMLVYGTILPFALVGIGGKPGWICFGIVTFVTLLGIVLSAIDVDRFTVMEVICHLVNGWSMLIYLKYLVANIGAAGVWLVAIGGIMYSIGAILYGIGSSKKYIHSVFHIFCILGSLFHYLAIYLYIL